MGRKTYPIDFVAKGLPEHYRNTHPGKKAIEKVMKECVNDGWILITLKRTGKSSEEHVSLNSRKVGEIQRFLEEG